MKILTCFLRADSANHSRTPTATPGRQTKYITLKKSEKKKEIGYLILQRHEQEQGPQQRARINHIHTVTAAKSAKMPDCCWRCHCSRRGDICSGLQRNNGKPHHAQKNPTMRSHSAECCVARTKTSTCLTQQVAEKN